MTSDSRASEALTAAAKQRAEYEKNVRQQMLEQPDYWQFTYAYVFSALDNHQCIGADNNIKGLNRAQTVLFLSGVTTMLEFISGKFGLELAKIARETAIIGGWALREAADSEAAETYLLRKSRGVDDPETLFTLAFSHPADPFAVLWVDIGLAAGTRGWDICGARMGLPKGYYGAANAFLLEGDLGPKTKFDKCEELDPKIGRKSAEMCLSENIGREGWVKEFSGDISEMPLGDDLTDNSMAGFHVVFAAKAQDVFI